MNEEVLFVFDAGHGGKDPGAVGNGYQEKDFVLLLAKKTAGYLVANYEKAKVIFTRSSDVFLELPDRAAAANGAGADYFISFHLNSNKNKDANGFETFSQPGSSAKTVAFQEAVHNEIAAYVKEHGIRDRGIKTQNLSVLRNTKMTAVLTESLFVSNVREAALLKDSSFVEGLARAHADGMAKGAGLTKKASAAASTPNVKPKQEEETKLYQPSNASIKNSTRTVLNRLVEKDPNGIDPSWVKKLDEGTLTESDATGLLFVAVERGLIQGTKD